MTEKKERKPELRFKGFDDEWTSSAMRDLCDTFTDGDWIEAKDQSSSGVRLIQTGNVGVAEFLDKPDTKKWISYETFVKLNCEEVYPDDILISRLPDPAGRACVVPDLDGRLITAVDCTIVRPSEKCYNKYLVQYLSTETYFHNINNLLAGGTRQRVSRGNLAKLTISHPNNISEQKVIGNYLETLDSLITTHQHKSNQLQNLKKAMLEKMFPRDGTDVPEIRFKGFDGVWEPRKLGDLYQKIRNAFVGTATPYYVDAGHFYLESNNIKNGQINYHSKIYINDEFYEKQRDNWLHTGDLVMVQSGHVGHTAVIPKELDNTAAHAVIIIANPVSKTNPYFMNYLFQNTISKSRIANITTGNTIKHILSSEMKKFDIILPDYNEQKKIGAYFQHLDTLITHQQKKLEHLKHLKSALLEKMFVSEKAA